jgi:hypothetical protein
MSVNKEQILKEFQIIPGIGKSIAQDLWDLEIRSIDDLKQKDPQDLYDKLCELHNAKIDRCILYVFRLATYFASTNNHDPHLLKWWNWKDQE